MEKRKVLGIASFFMIIVMVILFADNKHGFVLGDFILTKMGVNVWSDGNSGLHYTGALAAILILVGIAGVIRFKKDVHINFGKFAVIFFIVGIIIYQPTYDSVYGFVKSNLNGLHSIEYIRDGSEINFTSDSKSISIDGKIKLKNFSNDKKEFYIKLPIGRNPMAQNPEFITVCNTSNEPAKFVMWPKSQVNLHIKFSIQRDEKSVLQSGNLISPDIKIYNESEEIRQGKR